MSYKLMLKKLREQAGLTQAELAERSGIKLGTLRSWEQESSSATPRLDDAFAICDVLHCTPNDLCGWYLSHPSDRPPSSSLSHDEEVLLGNYRRCTPAKAEFARESVRMAADTSEASGKGSGSYEEATA